MASRKQELLRQVRTGPTPSGVKNEEVLNQTNTSTRGNGGSGGQRRRSSRRQAHPVTTTTTTTTTTTNSSSNSEQESATTPTTGSDTANVGVGVQTRGRNRRRRTGHASEPSRKRQNKRAERIFDVDPIGEFSTKEVFKTSIHVGPATLVRFDYLGPDETYILCWMDEEGRRHHSYSHSGTQWSHQENTHAGHAFAIFRKRDGKLLASYRIKAALAEGQVHVVRLPKLRARAETVVVEARVIAELAAPVEFPSNAEWVVSYSFSVPPLPQSDKPDFFETNTIYVWGDLSFDEFSLSSSQGQQHPIHSYKMNQIVPQVMCGECLCGSDPTTFVPYWKTFTSWVAQAQHYYQTEQGEALGSRAVCGELFAVDPGERMRTTIRFTGTSMVVRIASEDKPANFSEIVTDNPFPNAPEIFPGGWAELFQRKERKTTKTFRAYPCFNIEYKSQNADLDMLESLCPFKIHEATFPGSTANTPEAMSNVWHVRSMNFVPKNNVPMVEFK